MADVNMEGFANGHGSTNGVAKTNNNPVSNVEKVVNGEHKSSGTITNGVSNVELSHLTMKQDLQLRPIEVTRKYRGELASMNRDAISHTESVECFLDFVAADRLRRIPHKGSRWDKILRLSEYFTTQVSLYHESVGQFVPNSQESAQLIWACCRILIQVLSSMVI